MGNNPVGLRVNLQSAAISSVKCKTIRKLVLFSLCATVVSLSASGCGSTAPVGVADVQSDAEEATTFTEFPLLWLGESYDADGDGVDEMPLFDIDHPRQPALVNPETGEEVIPSVRSFGFFYGACEIESGEDSCTVPITIIFYPPNTRPPLYPAGSGTGPALGSTISVRGIDAQIYNAGNLRLDTADFTVTISPSFAAAGERLNQSLRIASLLTGANALASEFTPGSDFRPPTAPTPLPSIEVANSNAGNR